MRVTKPKAIPLYVPELEKERSNSCRSNEPLFMAGWRSGETMTWEQAIAEALKVG
jgi:hypothetical protein